jgi:inorganic pyrophosphatase
VLPRAVGGYPVNYGFVPQTVSYDGDPFDALVLGRTLRGGALVRGEIVGILHMEDEKGVDSKVVLSPVMMGKRLHDLTEDDRTRIAQFFARYKDHEPGKFSRVLGWGTPEEGLAWVRQTHMFFRTRGDCAKGAKGKAQREANGAHPSGAGPLPEAEARSSVFSVDSSTL